MLNRIEFLDIYDDPHDPKSLEIIEAFLEECDRILSSDAEERPKEYEKVNIRK